MNTLTPDHQSRLDRKIDEGTAISEEPLVRIILSGTISIYP